MSTRSRTRASAAQAAVIRFISSPDLQAVVFFCAIGSLATINVVLRFPEFGRAAAQLICIP